MAISDREMAGHHLISGLRAAVTFSNFVGRCHTPAAACVGCLFLDPVHIIIRSTGILRSCVIQSYHLQFFCSKWADVQQSNVEFDSHRRCMSAARLHDAGI